MKNSRKRYTEVSKRIKYKKLIKESIKKSIITEQPTGPFQLGTLMVNIGDTVYIATAGGPSVAVPNNLSPQPTPSTPHYANQDIFLFDSNICPQNTSGVSATTCCYERPFVIDANNISCIQNKFFNGTTFKPGVYISATYNEALNNCSSDYPDNFNPFEKTEIGISEEFDGKQFKDYVKPENQHLFDTLSADIPNLQVADPITPVPSKKIDPEIDRMQKLANIKRKR